MPLLVGRVRQAPPVARRLARGARRRPRRVFRPQPVAALEGRALLSTFAATAPPVSPHARPDDPGTTVSWPQLQDVTFPTTGDRSEQLDVYLPATPAPAGGYPVMIAIHGGAWRKLDKGAFGLRTAQGFTPYGYAVVAPNYLLTFRPTCAGPEPGAAWGVRRQPAPGRVPSDPAGAR